MSLPRSCMQPTCPALHPQAIRPCPCPRKWQLTAGAGACPAGCAAGACACVPPGGVLRSSRSRSTAPVCTSSTACCPDLHDRTAHHQSRWWTGGKCVSKHGNCAPVFARVYACVCVHLSQLKLRPLQSPSQPVGLHGNLHRHSIYAAGTRATPLTEKHSSPIHQYQAPGGLGGLTWRWTRLRGRSWARSTPGPRTSCRHAACCPAPADGVKVADEPTRQQR